MNKKSSRFAPGFIRNLSLLLLLLLCGQMAYAQKAQRLMPEKTRILFVLDGSGSMQAEWDGSYRIDIAKEKMSEIIDSLKINKNIELALRIYGHQFPPKAQNCKDSKLEVPFQAGNHDQVKARLMALKPNGVTPIAYSLEQATKDFPDDKNYRNLIIMITDGLESCKGDPCAISMGLQKKGILLKPYIIGLGVGKDFSAAFSCMGRAYDARSGKEFKQLLSTVIRQTVGKTTVCVELMDSNNKPTETNVNMTFINRVTGEAIYDLVHYQNNKGKTDTLQIDAAIDYDIIVNTLPAVSKENIVIEGGRHNTIRIPSPQGSLRVSLRTSAEYGTLKAIVRKSGEMNTLYAQKANTEQKYLVGTYDIEVLTLPRVYFKNVQVKQSQLTEVFVDQPGIVNLSNMLEGYCSLYSISENKEAQWIYDIDYQSKSMNLALQPGNYKLVIRAKDAKGSVYTIIKRFTVTAGKAVDVNILG